MPSHSISRPLSTIVVVLHMIGMKYINDSTANKQTQQARLQPTLCFYLLERWVTNNGVTVGNRPLVDEIAAFAVHTAAALEEDSTLFSFVFRVELLVLPEFLRPVCKLTLLLIGTKTLFHKLFAELRFFFILLNRRFGLVVCGMIARRRGVFSGKRAICLFTALGRELLGKWQL